MNIDDISKLVSTSKNININNLDSKNENINTQLKNIIIFIQTLFENHQDIIEVYKNTNIRFCDYYDASALHGEDIVNFFNNTYLGDNKENITLAFCLYVVLKNSEDLIYNFDICDNIDELYMLLNNNFYFEDINFVVDYIKKSRILLDEEVELDFLNENNKYKILFSGFSYKDISLLEKHIKKALIKKISGQLSTSDVVSLSEAIGHVKDRFGFPIARIQFADDYRIAYLRKDDVTVILGVKLKTGKKSDYTRYDSIAAKGDLIYKEIQLFKEGLLSKDSVHYQTLDLLREFQKNNYQKK